MCSSLNLLEFATCLVVGLIDSEGRHLVFLESHLCPLPQKYSVLAAVGRDGQPPRAHDKNPGTFNLVKIQVFLMRIKPRKGHFRIQYQYSVQFTQWDQEGRGRGRRTHTRIYLAAPACEEDGAVPSLQSDRLITGKHSTMGADRSGPRVRVRVRRGTGHGEKEAYEEVHAW